MSTPLCSTPTCAKDAVVSVKYFQDGSGIKFACGMHTVKTIETVLTGPNVGEATVRVTAISELIKRVEKTRRNNHG